MKPVTKFEIVDHGIENEQYFQGCGTAYTEFEDVATGIGDDFAGAVNDALEMLAQSGYDVASIEEDKETANMLTMVSPSVSDECGDDEDCDAHYYVSIRVK